MVTDRASFLGIRCKGPLACCSLHASQVLSRAFKNRFVELHFDELPSSELETILHKRCSLPPSYCSKLVKVMLDLQVFHLSSLGDDWTVLIRFGDQNLRPPGVETAVHFIITFYYFIIFSWSKDRIFNMHSINIHSFGFVL